VGAGFTPPKKGKTMAAVLLRLCDEDREKYAQPGWPEWIRFDEHDLDDQDMVTLNEFESELNVSLEFLLLVDKPSRTVRWKGAQVWLGLRMAGHQVPPLPEFRIKVRQIQVKDEVAARPKEDEPKPKRTTKPRAGDADPPSSSPSSEAEVSETVSA